MCIFGCHVHYFVKYFKRKNPNQLAEIQHLKIGDYPEKENFPSPYLNNTPFHSWSYCLVVFMCACASVCVSFISIVFLYPIFVFLLWIMNIISGTCDRFISMVLWRKVCLQWFICITSMNVCHGCSESKVVWSWDHAITAVDLCHSRKGTLLSLLWV